MDEPQREAWLSTEDVIERIRQAMDEKKPLSVVRVGDGENICLAQYKVWPIKKTLATRWARLSRTTNWKGVRLPNVAIRDQLIESIKKADIVGIPYENDREILAKPHTLRPLTDRCFRRYDIRPKAICHTFVNRHMVEYEAFWEMLRGKKAVVISRWAGGFKRWVGTKYNDYDIDFTKLIRIDRFEEIPKVMRKMESVECDIVLISAGVNAVILADRLARKQGRVAIDFGKSAVFMVKGNRKVRPWRPKAEKAMVEVSSAGAPSGESPEGTEKAGFDGRGRGSLNITVIGSGYVGTTTALVLAKLGHQVIGYDVDAAKVDKLNRGELPFREPGLDELLDELLQDGKIVFTADAETAVRSGQLLMISVGTPSAADGNADLTYLESAIDTIAEHIDGPKIVVTKSTVPIGTNRWMKERLAAKVDPSKTPVDVVSNPEFLREGSALQDSMHPSRTVVGGENPAAIETVKQLYAGLETTYFTCDYETAELIKYASNGFLAAKISYINEIARLAEAVGADITGVAYGMGMDPRISPHHLSAGIGYGGSCFPKDVDELLHLAKRMNVRLSLLEQAKQVNDTQIDWFIERMQKVAPLKGQRVLVLGVAFKEDTDDQRVSPGIRVMERLLKNGAAEVRAFDPTVRSEDDIRWTKPLDDRIKKRVTVATNPESAADGVHAVVLTTPWSSFRSLPWKEWAAAAEKPVAFDGRNFLDGAELRSLGWTYYGVARGSGG